MANNNEDNKPLTEEEKRRGLTKEDREEDREFEQGERMERTVFRGSPREAANLFFGANIGKALFPKKDTENTETDVIGDDKEQIVKNDDFEEKPSFNELKERSKVFFKRVIKASQLIAGRLVVGSKDRIILRNRGVIDIYNSDNKKISLGTGDFGAGILAYFNNSEELSSDISQAPRGLQIRFFLNDTTSGVAIRVDSVTNNPSFNPSSDTPMDLGIPTNGWNRLMLNSQDSNDIFAVLVDSAGTLTTSETS